MTLLGQNFRRYIVRRSTQRAAQTDTVMGIVLHGDLRDDNENALALTVALPLHVGLLSVTVAVAYV